MEGGALVTGTRADGTYKLYALEDQSTKGVLVENIIEPGTRPGLSKYRTVTRENLCPRPV